MKVNACIVLYKTKISSSETFRSILKLNMVSFFNHIYIYCNSKSLIDVDLNPECFKVVENKRNLFLYDNYLDALTQSDAHDVEYLAVFDQDSSLSLAYFDCLNLLMKNKDKYSAIYPKIICNSNQISPMTLKNGFAKDVINRDEIIDKAFIGINSGAVLNVKDFLGFNILDSDFKLDYLDYAICYNLYKEKLNVKVIDAEVNHSLSVSSNDSICDSRAFSILDSERRYIKKYYGNRVLWCYYFKMMQRLTCAILPCGYKFNVKQLILVMRGE